MVQHIVLWTFKDGIDKQAEFAKLQEGFAAFSSDVPGMEKLTLYRCFGGYDVCLISFHQDRRALEVYQRHPAHLAIKKVVVAGRQARASCDFELP